MKFLRQFLFIAALIGSFCSPAAAQFAGYFSPQGVVVTPFSAVTTAGVSSNLRNLGQTIHLMTYSVSGGGATVLDIRLDGSYDGVTWFAISDDATDSVQGQVEAVGYYPFLRANLVACTGCGGAVAVTAKYSGISSSPSQLFGFYNQSQQVRKVVFLNASQNVDQTVTIGTPYGSSGGFLVIINPTIDFPALSTFLVNGRMGPQGIPFSILNYIVPSGTGTVTVPIPAEAATSLDVRYSPNGVGTSTFHAFVVFWQPQSFYPAQQGPQNAEFVSAANTAVNGSVSSVNGARAHLYSISARCSAGTATLTVKDNGTTVWSSATGEVGTTTFRYQWVPGMATNRPTFAGGAYVVTLSSCGGGNVGTLDIQGSAF